MPVRAVRAELVAASSTAVMLPLAIRVRMATPENPARPARSGVVAHRAVLGTRRRCRRRLDLSDQHPNGTNRLGNDAAFGGARCCQCKRGRRRFRDVLHVWIGLYGRESCRCQQSSGYYRGVLTGSPIDATMVTGGTTPSGSMDALGDASLLTVTYQITLPQGGWSTLPAGTYAVTPGGSVTDLAGNSAATGPAGTFSVSRPPVVTSVSPAAGTLSGGTPVTISGARASATRRRSISAAPRRRLLATRQRRSRPPAPRERAPSM